MRYLTGMLVWVCMCASLGVTAQETQKKKKVRDVTLPEAISLGLTRSPQLEAARLASQKAAVRIDEAAYGWSPKIKVRSTLVPMPRLEEDDTDFAVFSAFDSFGIFTRNELSVVIPVFTFFKLTTAEELASIGLDVAQLEEEQVRLQITYDVVRAYYALQLAKALDTVADDSESFIGRADSALDRLLKEGAEGVDKKDKNRLDVAKAELEIRAIEVKQGEMLAREAMRVHTNLGAFRIPKMNFRPDEVELQSLEAVQSLARRNRVDLKMLSKGLEAQRLNLELETLKWFPDFAVAAQVNYSFSDAVEEVPEDEDSIYVNDPFNAFGIGALLVLEWNIDPVQRSFRVEREDIELSRLEKLRDLAWRGADLEVQKAYFETVLALETVGITRKARRSAKRLNTQDLADYELGGGDIDDVVRSLQGYFTKRVEYLQALFEFRVSIARLQLLTGATSINDLLVSGTIEDFEVDE